MATVHWDRNNQLTSPVLKLGGHALPLDHPKVTLSTATELRLVYALRAPDGTSLTVVRNLKLTHRGHEIDLVEEFQLTPEKPITTDLDIQRPFTITDTQSGSAASAICPMYNGWAKPYALSDRSLDVEYRMGNTVNGDKVERTIVASGAIGQTRRMAGGHFDRLPLQRAL